MNEIDKRVDRKEQNFSRYRKKKPVNKNKRPSPPEYTRKKKTQKTKEQRQKHHQKEYESLKINPKIQKEPDRKGGSNNKKRVKKKLTKAEFERRRKQKRKTNMIEIIKFMLPIVFLSILVFLFILKTSPHMVDGDSMKPTLINEDRVIVRRTRKPKRYEIITFKPPVKSEFQYVKRIIGMPGDLIWIEGNDLFINQQTESVPNELELSAASELPDGTLKVNISEKTLSQLASLDKIPKGHYFVLGDNRKNSSDSRTFGLVDGKAVEGVVSFRFAPFKQMGWIK